MTLDTLVQSLGSESRNLGAHSIILVQQQQQAAAAAGGGGGAAAAGQTQAPGCGGAQAMLQCCYHRLSHSAQQRTRGIIVLSLEHSSRVWLQTPAIPASANAPPRLILDACSNRFLLPAAASAAAAAADAVAPIAATPAASEPTPLSTHPRTSVQRLQAHEIRSLQAMRVLIEAAARQMNAQHVAAQAATPSATAATPAATAPSAVSSSLDNVESSAADSCSCSSVTLVIDDLLSLLVRFGSARTLAFLQALKSAAGCNLALLVGVDSDGLASMAPLQVGSGTENTQVHQSSVGLHAHLAHLASTTIAIRNMRPLLPTQQQDGAPTGGAGSASVGGGGFVALVHVLHKRPSGKVTNVLEEMEIQSRQGIVRKITAQVAAAAVAAEAERAASKAATTSTAATASLAQQFGSSFSLDLTSKAKSARANIVLPYQHTGQAVGWNSGSDVPVSSIDAPEEDELISDDDQDFDDPDDDLEV